VISQAADAMDHYSDSADDCETIPCFFDFQEIGLFPRKIQYPVIDHLVVGQLAQAKSQGACSFKGLAEESRIRLM